MGHRSPPHQLYYTAKNGTLPGIDYPGGIGYVDDRIFVGDFVSMRALLAELGAPYRAIDRYYNESSAVHWLGLNAESFISEQLRSGRHAFVQNKAWPTTEPVRRKVRGFGWNQSYCDTFTFV